MNDRAGNSCRPPSWSSVAPFCRVAVVTITPRSALHLTAATTRLTIDGRLRSGLDSFTGTAAITVTLSATLGTDVLLPGAQLNFSNPSNFSNALISQNQNYILLLQT